jgi:hypothetical protein
MGCEQAAQRPVKLDGMSFEDLNRSFHLKANEQCCCKGYLPSKIRQSGHRRANESEGDRERNFTGEGGGV